MKRPVVIGLLAAAMIFVCVSIGAVIIFTSRGISTNNPFDRRNVASMLEENKTIKVDPEKPITLKVADAAGEWRLAAYLGYATLVSLVMLGAVTFALTRRGGRALGRRR